MRTSKPLLLPYANILTEIHQYIYDILRLRNSNINIKKLIINNELLWTIIQLTFYL